MCAYKRNSCVAVEDAYPWPWVCLPGTCRCLKCTDQDQHTSLLLNSFLSKDSCVPFSSSTSRVKSVPHKLVARVYSIEMSPYTASLPHLMMMLPELHPKHLLLTGMDTLSICFGFIHSSLLTHSRYHTAAFFLFDSEDALHIEVKSITVVAISGIQWHFPWWLFGSVCWLNKNLLAHFCQLLRAGAESSVVCVSGLALTVVILL